MANRREERMQELTQRLQEGVRDVFDSEKYTEYLRVMSRFHRYSYRNTLLIAMQNPEATMVAGYQAWQKNFNRHVNRGEQAITIISPAPYKTKRDRQVMDPTTHEPVRNEDGSVRIEEVEVTIPAFRPAAVFDISQTSGDPIPSLFTNIEGNVQNYEDFMDAMGKVAPVPIVFEPMNGKDGFYQQVEKKIHLRDDMSQRQTIAAVIHETAHAKLHALDFDHLQESLKARGKDSRTMEVEAESIAYVVSQHYGIETGENSFGYIAMWSKNKELPELQASLQLIRDTAAGMIDGIDERLAEIRKEREQLQAKPSRALETAEELEEVNYNMIDDVLNNLPPAEEKEKKASITFYVAECEEFHDMGEYIDGLTMDQAVEKYREILDDPRRAYMGNAMGFILHDPELEDYSDTPYPLVQGHVIRGDNLDAVEAYLLHPLVQEALDSLQERLTDFEYRPPVTVLQAYYPEQMNAGELAAALDQIVHDFDPYRYDDARDPLVDPAEEIRLTLLSGNALQYAPMLQEIAEDGGELSGRAAALLERLKAYQPETVQNMEPVARVLFCEDASLGLGGHLPLSELEEKTAMLDREISAKEPSEAGELPETCRLQVMIYYAEGEQLHSIPGKMNIGDGDGGLLASMYAENEARLNDPAWMAYKESQGQEVYEKYVREIGDMQEHVLPYLQSFCSLEEREPEKAAAEIRTETSAARAEIVTAAKAAPEKKPSIHDRLKSNREIIAKQAGNAVAKGKEAEIV